MDKGVDKRKATEKLDAVVGRAIRDKNFRARLVKNPKAVLKAEGLTAEDIDAITGGARLFSSARNMNFSFYGNIAAMFKSIVPDIGKVAASTEKNCNERG